MAGSLVAGKWFNSSNSPLSRDYLVDYTQIEVVAEQTGDFGLVCFSILVAV